MLNHLRHTLGDEKFFQGAREFFQTYSGRSIGTPEFRSFWKLRLGSQKDSLDIWLDSPGGLPELKEPVQLGGLALLSVRLSGRAVLPSLWPAFVSTALCSRGD